MGNDKVILPTKFRVYADLKDGKGVTMRPRRYGSRSTAMSEADRLTKGKTQANRVYVVPVRPGERGYMRMEVVQ